MFLLGMVVLHSERAHNSLELSRSPGALERLTTSISSINSHESEAIASNEVRDDSGKLMRGKGMLVMFRGAPEFLCIFCSS